MNEKPALRSATPYGGNITSIPTGRTDVFAYSPVFLTNCYELVQITMSGSRDDDRTNTITASPSCPSNTKYVCHHTYSFVAGTDSSSCTCHAQMVKKKAHQASCPHLGAVDQYNKHYNGRHIYRMAAGEHLYSDKQRQDTPDPIFVDKNMAATDADIDKFISKYRFKITDYIARVFKGKLGMPVEHKTSAGFVATIQEIIPLRSDDKDVFTAEYILDLPNMIEVFDRLFPNSRANKPIIPFGTDPCGNLFLFVIDKVDDRLVSRILFYDHEEDAVYEVSEL